MTLHLWSAAAVLVPVAAIHLPPRVLLALALVALTFALCTPYLRAEYDYLFATKKENE